MVVDQLTEGLDAGDHPWGNVAVFEDLPIDPDSGLAGSTDQFALHVAVVATVDSQPFGNREDELPVGHWDTDGLCDRLGG